MDETWLYQYNNQWSCGIAAHRAPKNFGWKIPWTGSRFYFLGSRRHPHPAKILRPNFTHRCWCNWRTFWKINAAGRSQRGPCCTTILWLTLQLQGRRKWSTWASSILNTHSIFRIWPHLFPVLKIQLKFDRSEVNCSYRDLHGRKIFWIFWVACRS